MSEISVIIVSWNARDYLRDCLVSVRESGGRLVREVIVVDNASTDGSTEMVAGEFPEVTLVSVDKNLGFARANNLGLKRSSGTYFAMVNSDVIVHEQCFARLVEYLEIHHDVGLVGPKILGRDGRLQRTCRQLPSLWNTTCRTFALDSVFSGWPLFSGREMRHWNHDNQIETEVLSGCFWMARRKAVDDVGGLDERYFFYAEDVDWCKRFWDKGWKVKFMPRATATHYGGASSANAPLLYSVEMLRANLKYWEKHHGLIGLGLFYLLCVLHHTFRLIARGLNIFVRNSAATATQRTVKYHVHCLRWLLTGKQTEN